MITPYYQDDYCTIYHGDCRDILPTIDNVDLVLTDPPYGVNFKHSEWDDSEESWHRLMTEVIPLMINKSQMTIFPCCQIARLSFYYTKFTPDWIICWYKGATPIRSYIGFNDWEPLLVYGKIKGCCMHDYILSIPEPHDNGHPCQKPLKLFKEIIYKTKARTIIDPFMGSGTTLRAVKDLERQAIGIEIEEKYCEIAVKRLSQEVLPLSTALTRSPSRTAK